MLPYWQRRRNAYKDGTAKQVIEVPSAESTRMEAPQVLMEWSLERVSPPHPTRGSGGAS